MRRAADAGRRIAELAGPFLDVFDQLRDRVDRQRRIDHQDERRLHIERDRHEILQRIVRHGLEQCRADRHHRAGRNDHGVAVGGRGLQRRDTGEAGAARLVLDHDRLAERLRELLGIKPHGDIEAGAGREQRHDIDRSGWEGFGAQRRE